MSTTWNVPPLGDGVSEGTVAQLVAETGARVSAGEPLLEIETDKVVMEVPAPADGVIEQWLVAPGETLAAGAPFARVTEAWATPAANGHGGRDQTLAPADMSQSRRNDNRAPAVAPDGTSRDDTWPPEQLRNTATTGATPLVTAGMSTPALRPGESTDTSPPEQARAARGSANASQRDGFEGSAPAGPAARRLARELGVALVEVVGSGARGRISKDDVKRHVRERGQPATAPGPVAELPDLSRFGEITREPLDAVGRTIAGNMQRAWREVPHAWVSRNVPIDELERARARLREIDPQLPLTMTALLTRALAQTLRAFPNFNASYDSVRRERLLRADINVGVAVDTPRGLLVPVLRNTDRLSLGEIARELSRLAGSARSGKLDPSALQGGSITLSNLGGLGADGLMPMVNWPEVAIVGAGATRRQLELHDGELRERSMLPLTIGFDHRVINGADAARLLAHLAMLLQEPMALAL